MRWLISRPTSCEHNSLGLTHGALEITGNDLTTYRYITQQYHLTRRTLTQTNAKLTMEEAQIWRTLQTSSFPHRTQMHAALPTTALLPRSVRDDTALTRFTTPVSAPRTHSPPAHLYPLGAGLG